MRPRRNGFHHRPVLAVVDEVEVTEDGEVIDDVVRQVGITEDGEVIDDIAEHARNAPASVWIVLNPVTLLHTLLAQYESVPAFNYQLVESVDDEDGTRHSSARLTRFGFKCRCTRDHIRDVGCTCGNPPKRKDAMHVCWTPGDLARRATDYMDGFTHTDLLKFAINVRDWCAEQNIPVPTSLSAIAAGLLRDARFWPHLRGRVPRATNENVRKYLPGVHSELFAQPARRVKRAMSLDQQRAYHHAAQEVPTPDPTTMYARGYYIEPETSPIWCVPGDPVFERTVRQPGVVFVQYSARPVRKHEFRPPWVESGRNRAAVYTNELNYVDTLGVHIEGIVAAWTSSSIDTGLPRYGEWAADQIRTADDYRKRWLKPTLHAAYGLLAMREREVSVGHLRGTGAKGKFILGAGYEFTVHKRTLPRLPSPTTNVPMLGVLQAEIRTRSLKMAAALSSEGLTVLHVHADGIHVEGDSLPLIPAGWTVKPKTNLHYIDRVSWLSDEGDVLPGRDEQLAVETRRRHARQPYVATAAHRKRQIA